MEKSISLSAAVYAGSTQHDAGIFNAGIRKIIHSQSYMLIKSGWFPKHMRDDLDQELSLILLAEFKYFDPAKSSFPTFAKQVLKKRSLNLVENSRTIKAGGNVEMLSLDIDVNEEGESLCELLEFDSTRIMMGVQNRPESEMAELRESMAYALTLLDPELRDICVAVMGGENISGLARRYNMSRAGFRKTYLLRIRKVFLAAGLGDF